eukprot:SAG25_NODE_1586_length_2725_cov_2.005706_4_plen_110_part_00
MPPSFIARAGSRLAFPSTPTSHFAMPCMHRLAACELTCTLGTQVTTEVLIEHSLQAVGHCIEVWLAINVCPMYAFAQKSILVRRQHPARILRWRAQCVPYSVSGTVVLQ